MSVASTIKSDHSNLPDILEYYENQLKDAKENLKLDGKNIEAANVEQPSWLAYYDQIRVELEYLLQIYDMRVKVARAAARQHISKNSSYSYGQQELEKMVDGDPKYLTVNQYFIEVRATTERARSVVEAFAQRSYSLNNITKIRVAEVQNVTLRIKD